MRATAPWVGWRPSTACSGPAASTLSTRPGGWPARPAGSRNFGSPALCSAAAARRPIRRRSACPRWSRAPTPGSRRRPAAACSAGRPCRPTGQRCWAICRPRSTPRWRYWPRRCPTTRACWSTAWPCSMRTGWAKPWPCWCRRWTCRPSATSRWSNVAFGRNCPAVRAVRRCGCQARSCCWVRRAVVRCPNPSAGPMRCGCPSLRSMPNR